MMPGLPREAGDNFSVLQVRDFRGGMNTRDHPLELLPNQLMLAQNVLISGKGSMVKRNGTSIWMNHAKVPGSENNKVRALKRIYRTGGYVTVIAVDDNKNSSSGKLWWAVDTQTSFGVTRQATDASVNFTLGANWEFVVFKNTLVALNGYQTPQILGLTGTPTWADLKIAAPSESATATIEDAADFENSLPKGKYRFVFVHEVSNTYDPRYGWHSGPSRSFYSPLTIEVPDRVAATYKKIIRIADCPTPTAGRIIQIYATEPDGGRYYLLHEYDADHVPAPFDWTNIATLGFTELPDDAISAGDPPTGPVAATWGDRLWIASGTSVYFSSIENPCNFPAENEVIVSEDNSPITALYPFTLGLLVLTRGSVGVIEETDLGFIYRRISSFRGCVATKSVASVGPYVVFLSWDGVYAIRRAGEDTLAGAYLIERPISAPITPDILAAAYKVNAAGIADGTRYYLALNNGTGTTNNTLWVADFNHAYEMDADTQLCSWTKHYSSVSGAMEFSCFDRWIGNEGDGRGQIYAGSDVAGRVVKLFDALVPNADTIPTGSTTTSILARVETPRYLISDWYEAQFWGLVFRARSNADLTIEVLTDEGIGTHARDYITFGTNVRQGGVIFPVTFPITFPTEPKLEGYRRHFNQKVIGRDLQLKIFDGGQDSRCDITSLSALTEQTERLEWDQL